MLGENTTILLLLFIENNLGKHSLETALKVFLQIYPAHILSLDLFKESCFTFVF